MWHYQFFFNFYSLSIYLTVISLHHRFSSNYHGGDRGFKIKYEFTNVPRFGYNYGICGGSFTTSNGFFTSPSYPYNYPENIHCIYTISLSTGGVILLKFLSIDLEYHREGHYDNDYLEIRDGPTENSNLLAEICCSEIPAPIHSSQNQLWIK